MRIFERGGKRIEVTVDPDSPIQAKWDADRQCRQLVADGWLRVAGSAEELASQPELLAALRANREDRETYAIFADWLCEHGDPWGQLMAVQVALAALPRVGQAQRRDELEREEIKLRFQHAARLWGPIGEQIIDVETQRYASDIVDAEWRCGFVRAAQFRDTAERIEAVLPQFAKLEIAQLLRSLAIEPTEWRRATADVLAAQAWPELTRLTVASHGYGPTRRAIDARWIVPALATEVTPRLTELEVRGSHSTDGLCIALATNPIHERLQYLELLGGQLTEEGIAALASGSLRLLHLKLTGRGPQDARAMLARTAKTVIVVFDQAD
ncbi:MAG: TIGR02996 domain-containing protein [Kofleriaceae bacterium]